LINGNVCFKFKLTVTVFGYYNNKQFSNKHNGHRWNTACSTKRNLRHSNFMQAETHCKSWTYYKASACFKAFWKEPNHVHMQ